MTDTRVAACDSEQCATLPPTTSHYYHLAAAAETEIAERLGRAPRPVEPDECPFARVPTDESRAMADAVVNAPPKTPAEEAADLAWIRSYLAKLPGGSDAPC